MARKDSRGRNLRTGESERKDGIYMYRYTDVKSGKRQTIYAGDLPELEEDTKETELAIVETLAHEYKHFMQHCEGREFDEEEAENFATQVLADFRKRGCDNGND